MKLIDRIKSFFVARYHIKEYVNKNEQELKYYIRSEHLKNCIYTNREIGISDTKYCEHEIIVSLTTYGKRLFEVATTIESIMQGSMLPNRIILWLDDSLKQETLPISLKLQEKRGLTIKFCKDLRSFKKLIPSMNAFPNDAIITIDDDLIYERDLVENLYRTHINNPNCICANRIHEIVLVNNKPINYTNWNMCISPSCSSPLHFPTTGAGTLFPPHCFDDEVFNESVFMDICKYADDVWFYCMALKKGTKTVKSFTHSPIGEDYQENIHVQDISLKHINKYGNHLNDEQLGSVLGKYELYNLLKTVENEN